MRKKLTVIILVLAIILQLSVPAVMIVYSKNVEGGLAENGKEFKVKVDVRSVYDGSIQYDAEGYYDWYDIGYYATIEEDSDGYAGLFENVGASKPETDYYIRVTMDNKAKIADYKTDVDISAWKIEEESAHLIIKVYKGEFEVVGLYIDNMPAEDWLETATVEQNEYNFTTLRQK